MLTGKPTNPTTSISELAKELEGEEMGTPQGSQSISYLMKEGTVRQSLCPWAGARVFHVDVVHGWQFGNLCGFAAAVVDAAGAGRALPFLSDQSLKRSVRV